MSQNKSADLFNRLFVKACQDHENGFLDKAGSAYIKLLESFPQAPVLHYNLGLVYYELGDFQKGCSAFRIAAKLSPEDTDILFNLALSLKKSGDIAGAIAAFCYVSGKDPESVDTLYNLAGCYRETGRHAEAVETYQRVLHIEPTHRAATNNLAYMYHLIGENDKALLYYGKVLEYDPDHAGAKHMLAALAGNRAVTAPESYVVDIFDSYSQKYEQSLVGELEYYVPAQLHSMLDGSGWRKNFDHGLDLGCGTGLSGEPFAGKVARFDGIDLSAKMVDLARDKNIYTSLHQGNIISFLEKSPHIFDFFIAADVFGYVGDLTKMFALLKERARFDALFCFSTEYLQGESFRLRHTGRFAHSVQYVEGVAAETGWALLGRRKWPLRKERDGWVDGCLWFFQIKF